MNPTASSGQKSAALPASPAHLPSTDKHQQAYQKALRLIQEEHYQKAVDVLNTAGPAPAVLNAKGVCLLRLGAAPAALQLYRSYMLQPGTTWARRDLPVSHVLNFATALLLNGHPGGCREILGNLNQPDHPGVQRLQQAILTWQSSLPLWQRLNWKLGRIEPAGARVTIDFAPGELEPETHDQPV